MAQDKARLISLTIDSLHTPLQVIRFSGREALNQAYRFDIELLGSDPELDLQALLLQPAFLGFGLPGAGVHGLIHEISSGYLSPTQCHYQVVLGPRLTLLENRARRRAFHDLSVPEILGRLLDSHGLGPADYRLELGQGSYPARPYCQQHEQNDLQWLNRLCEEEGIHYHFEHGPRQHVLVLAEDPQAFPERQGLLRYSAMPGNGQPVVHQLHERYAMPGPVDGQRSPRTGNAPWPAICSRSPDEGAANQDGLHGLHSTNADIQQRHALQYSRRALERLRCDSRQIQGSSTLAALHSADVRHLDNHPRQAFNDQWLITEVHHWGEQQVNGERFPPQDDHLDDTSYHNHFKAIPWATPFRPTLRQARPQPRGYQLGTVLGTPGQSAQADAQGRLHIRLQDALHAPDNSPGCWLALGVAEGKAPPVGSQVLVCCVDNDPDQLVICGFLKDRDTDALPRADTPEAPGQIYLYEQPQEAGNCLAGSVWYIVRMPRPGLGALARLGRDDILLEGRSDDRGMVILSPCQRHRLALALADTPLQLWLLYPGQCLAMHEYLRQRWSPAQRRALLQASLNNASGHCLDELHSLHEWLIDPSS